VLTAAVIKLVKARDSYCWECGATEGLVLHHIVNRGQGGSKLLDRADNLIRVCSLYNSAMESDPEIAQTARELGHKQSRFGKQRQPVFDKVLGIWFTLNER